ncbi:hypothetical protein ACOSQ3_002333 [Xanthoceras sorbifolium]
MNFIFEVHLRRTTNPLGSISNPEGFEERRTLWVRDRTQTGSKIEPLWVRVFEPRRVHVFEPFWVRSRTQKGSKIEPFWVRDRTQRVRSSNPLGSTNPEGSFFEPSGFHEPRRVRIFEPFWVRSRTQRVRSSNPLGSTNPEGSFFEPSGFHEPRRVRRSNPPGFRTLWVRGTQSVRRTNPLEKPIAKLRTVSKCNVKQMEPQ